MNVQVKFAKLQRIAPNEGSDEMYYWLDGIDQRPAGSPDYWRFDNNTIRTIGQIVLEGSTGVQCTVNLREQDGGLRWEHDDLGTVRILWDGNTLGFEELDGTTYRGKYERFHEVDFTKDDGHYRAYFEGYLISDI